MRDPMNPDAVHHLMAGQPAEVPREDLDRGPRSLEGRREPVQVDPVAREKRGVFEDVDEDPDRPVAGIGH
jgi:hypothetical protein